MSQLEIAARIAVREYYWWQERRRKHPLWSKLPILPWCEKDVRWPFVK